MAEAQLRVPWPVPPDHEAAHRREAKERCRAGHPLHNVRLKLCANWNRAVAVLSWSLMRAWWLEDTRWWRNPTATAMAYAVLVLIPWNPDLVLLRVTFHVAAARVEVLAPHPCA
ncbi:hypothetical protein C2845_PM15G14890 [Panicum miliaceum]|uniref:Uncharacterized protein n=1 Tax=Panicum miliaceum TaxID=4540 RepID=A0A3L6Q6R8_PANMI|nr:hypothetical protein C2845_PM15G14890 [Panicum miliaceum]